jgi:ABC-type transport system substrate-binding protein
MAPTVAAPITRFNLPAYNQRYEESRQLGDTPRRTALYRDLADILHAYTPWVLLTHPVCRPAAAMAAALSPPPRRTN